MKRWFASIILVLLGLAAFASSGRWGRVAVVLAVEGKAQLGKKGDRPTRFRDVRVLDGISIGEVLLMESGCKLKLSVLKTGQRFELTGPLQVDVDSPEPIKAGPRVVELPSHSARDAIVASQQLDMSKFGGGSSRGVTKVFVDSDDPPLLNLDMLKTTKLETPSLAVYFKQSGGDWIKSNASLIHNELNNDDLIQVGGLRPQPNQAYDVRIGDEGEGQFSVVRFPEEDLEGLRELEEEANDAASSIELYNCYLHLQLYVKGNRLVESLKVRYPDEADWGWLNAEIKAARTSEKIQRP